MLKRSYFLKQVVKNKKLKKKPGVSIARSLFLSLNLLAVIALLFSLLAAHIPPSSGVVFSAFALFYPVFLIVNAFFVAFWLIFKSKLFLISLAFVLIGYSSLFQTLQFSISSNDDSNPENIHILSYNVERFGLYDSEEKFRKTRSDVMQYLMMEQAGIVCLQEYHGKGKTTLYEPLQDMKTDLGANSYYYESYFNPRYQQLTGLVTFSKYEAINKGKLKFDGSRTFGIYTDLIIKSDTVRVFNIHLASIQLMPDDIDFVANPGQDKEEVRLHALKIYSKLAKAFLLRQQQLIFLTEEIETCPYPIILVGDFNDTPSSYVYNNISNLLEDTFIEKGNGIGRTYAGILPLLRIDFILKSNKFRTQSYKRDKLHLSDHFPISACLINSANPE